MITTGTEKIINMNEEYVLLHIMSLNIPKLTITSLINDDLDAIIQCREEHMVKLNYKYEGLNLDDLNNFKSDTTVQQ